MILKLQWPFKVVKDARAVGINTPGNLYNSLKETYIAGTATSGMTVNANTAVGLSSVYRAINICADSLSLPINVYRKTGRSRDVITEQDEYWQAHYILHTSPNQLYTPSEWIRVMEMARLLYGNAYSVIIRNTLGKPIALRWIHPQYVDVYSNGIRLSYDVRDENGALLYQDLPYWNMIHVKALSLDGYLGKSPITVARESIGNALAQQKTSSDYYASGMKQKIVLSHPGTLGADGEKNLKGSFDEKMKGEGTIVLEEGLKPYPLTIPPADSQFLESRVFSVQEIARWYGLPPHMLGDTSRANYNTLEQQSLEFIRDSVRPRARMYEQEFNWKLLFNEPGYYTSFNMNALMRADAKTRADFYSLMIQNRVMNPNEAREHEDMNPYEGGDKFENPNISPGEPVSEPANNEDNGQEE